jgi:hypothetical protein
MRTWTMLVALTGLVGCIESNIQDERPQWDPANVKEVDGTYAEDVYVQSQPTQADILFVISNWWSMEQAYAELIDSFDNMLDVFVGSGVDYHIGVVSTDVDHSWEHGKLHMARGVKWIDDQNPDPYGTFGEMATMDASGCAGPRRPRDATLLAFEYEADGANAGYRRPGASAHTVFVSDDRDLSTMASLDEWVDWYNHFTETPEIDTLSAIVDLGKDGQNVDATQRIGGSYQHIADRPWNNVLAEIGLRAIGLRREYYLSSVPVIETIEVKVVTPGGAELAFTEGTVDEGGDYYYDEIRNSVKFHEFEPETDSTITIGYETAAR